MANRSFLLGSLLVSVLAVACGGAGESEEAEGSVESQEGAATGAAFRAVDIVVSAKRTGKNYEARSYPNDDLNGDGKTELYNAPLYYVYVDGVTREGVRVRREWQAPRYMPYYNNPASPDHHYSTKGFVTAGLSSVPRQPVPQYKPEYEVRNSFSPFGGAIVVKGTFYIHAGPTDASESGWGSAGCVEIVGNFDGFKQDILELAGSTATDLNKGIGQLVAARKLFVTYEQAARPNLKTAISRQVSSDETGADDATTNDSTNDRSEPTE